MGKLFHTDGPEAPNARSPRREAQLSQRDRAMLHVIGYFAKSLKVVRNDILEYGVYKTLVFYCNYCDCVYIVRF